MCRVTEAIMQYTPHVQYMQRIVRSGCCPVVICSSVVGHYNSNTVSLVWFPAAAAANLHWLYTVLEASLLDVGTMVSIMLPLLYHQCMIYWYLRPAMRGDGLKIGISCLVFERYSSSVPSQKLIDVTVEWQGFNKIAISQNHLQMAAKQFWYAN